MVPPRSSTAAAGVPAAAASRFALSTGVSPLSPPGQPVPCRSPRPPDRGFSGPRPSGEGRARRRRALLAGTRGAWDEALAEGGGKRRRRAGRAEPGPAPTPAGAREVALKGRCPPPLGPLLCLSGAGDGRGGAGAQIKSTYPLA